MTFELGVYSFGNTPRTAGGGYGPTAQAIRDVVGADYSSVLVRKHAGIRGGCRPVGLVCGHRGARSAQRRQHGLKE
jgi:hypothetical protein